MKIKIEELKTSGSLEINYLEEGKNIEVRAVEPIEVSLTVQYQPEYFILKGKIKGKSYLDCSRCVETFIYPIKIEFSSRTPASETNGETLDVSEEIRQQILLNLPLKPLCQEKCQGLCPKCGKNLNLEKCNCRNELVDPRLEKLKKLI